MKLKFKLLHVELEVEATPQEVIALTGAATGVGAITSLLQGLATSDTGAIQGQTDGEA